MDILKTIRHTDGGDKYLGNAINYIFNDRALEVNGYGVDNSDRNYAYNQMYKVKEYYGKTGDNPIMHFVISYGNEHVNNLETASDYTKQIAENLKDDYQLLTAIHCEDQGSSMYHAHIVMNSVNLNTGKLYHSGITELKQLAMQIHDITGTYCKINF